MLLVIVSLTLVCIFNNIFVKLWVGGELFAGYHFTIIYGAFILFSIARHNGYIMYQSFGRLRPIVIGHLIEIPLYIGLSIILIEIFGLVGVAYANIISSLPITIIAQTPFISNTMSCRN